MSGHRSGELSAGGADFTVVGIEAVLPNGKGTTYGVEFFMQQNLMNIFC